MTDAPDPIILDFFQSLWPDDVPEGSAILVWSLPGKRSIWCTTVAAAALAAAQLGATEDAYTMVSLQAQGLGEHTRGKATTARYLCGLWLDVDIAGDGHSAQPYPRSADQAKELIYHDSLPAPTWLIHSGGGYHAWWLFREPWELENAEEVTRAATLAEQWQAMYRHRAQTFGLTFDSTHDLQRVLRIPGTANRKLATPRPVVAEAKSDVRLEPSELAELVQDYWAAQKMAPPAAAPGKVVSIKPSPEETGGLALRPNATIANVDLGVLDARFKNFAASWYCDRTYASGKSSPSEHQMAIANFAALAGWSDQQIIDLLIHHRRVFAKKLPKHFTYYQKTLAEARKFAASKGIAPDDDEETAAPAAAEPGAITEPAAKREKKPEDPAAKLEKVRRRLQSELGLTVIALVKVGVQNPVYRLECEEGHVHFPSAKHLLEYASFRDALFSQLNIPIGYYKAADFAWIPGDLLQFLKNEAADSNAEPTARLLLQLDSYLMSNDLFESWPHLRDNDDFDLVENPHCDDGALFVNTGHLAKWLKNKNNETYDPRELGTMMPTIGAHKVHRWFTKPKRKRDFWRLPEDEFSPDDYMRKEEFSTADPQATTEDTSYVV